jgi:hypothetical protein
MRGRIFTVKCSNQLSISTPLDDGSCDSGHSVCGIFVSCFEPYPLKADRLLRDVLDHGGVQEAWEWLSGDTCVSRVFLLLVESQRRDAVVNDA